MAVQITTVSTKGQFVIPAEIREALGITPGTRIAVRQQGSQIVLEPISKQISNRLHGITKGGPSMTDELLKERKSEKW